MTPRDLSVAVVTVAAALAVLGWRLLRRPPAAPRCWQCNDPSCMGGPYCRYWPWPKDWRSGL